MRRTQLTYNHRKMLASSHIHNRVWHSRGCKGCFRSLDRVTATVQPPQQSLSFCGVLVTGGRKLPHHIRGMIAPRGASYPKTHNRCVKNLQSAIGSHPCIPHLLCYLYNTKKVKMSGQYMTLPKRQNQEFGVAVLVACKIALRSFVVASESLCLNVGRRKGKDESGNSKASR